MSRRVYLHVGAPKTGTTYVQDRLTLNRVELERHGVHYPLPGDKTAAHFHAAVDLLGKPWGYEETTGHWDGMVRHVNRLSGTVIISHEVLASADAEQVERVMGDFADSEVHIVYSARDLARQIPAEWQESIKNRRAWTFRRFLDRVQTEVRLKPDWWFWQVQSLPDVLSRWSAGLEPGRVHLVTVPQAGAPDGLLWSRFCEVFGIDPLWAPEDSERRNPSIGVAEAQVVRMLNRRLRKTDLDFHQKRELIKEVLVHQNLAGRAGQTKVTLPPRLFPWAEEVAEEWIEWVEGSGIDVVGDLQELRPVPPAEDVKWPNPDRPNRAETLDASLDALAAMTVEAARRPDPDAALTARIGRAARRLRGQ